MVSTRSSSQAFVTGGLAVGPQPDVPRSQMVIPDPQAAQAAQARETSLPAESLQPLPEPSVASKGKRPVRGSPSEAPSEPVELEGRSGASGLLGGGSEPSDSDPDDSDFPSLSEEESLTPTRRLRTREETSTEGRLL
ncbi:hypothetical protein BJX66DRAFT_301347, partial [Aspergillus keveii]